MVAIALTFVVSLLSTLSLHAATEQKRMVVVTPSYNNKDYYRENLDSIFGQDYENFRVIYVDDASTDGTGDLVDAYIQEHGLQDKATVIHNPKNMGGLYNLYHAIHSCDDDEIIVEMDGDDAFPHDQVLSYLNEVYADEDVWLTYGQYQNQPAEVAKQLGIGLKGYARPVSPQIVKNNNFRRVWVFMALRTFYAGLFKKIKHADMLVDKSVPEYAGTFYPESWDLVMMYPMLEMAGPRFKFIDEILYLRNIDNPLNSFKTKGNLQRKLSRSVRRKKKYTILDEKPF